MREIKFRAWDFESTEWLVDVEEHSLGWLTTSNIHLMQYTGLKDKNGKEIYEGDIIKQTHPNIHLDKGNTLLFEVVFESGSFVGKILGVRDIWHWVNWPWEFFDGCEVIGNIYENPELMGG